MLLDYIDHYGTQLTNVTNEHDLATYTCNVILWLLYRSTGKYTFKHSEVLALEIKKKLMLLWHTLECVRITAYFEVVYDRDPTVHNKIYDVSMFNIWQIILFRFKK